MVAEEEEQQQQQHASSAPSSAAKAPAAEEHAHARMKLLCSHGGKILPRPDGQLRYVGGDTRLVTFNKSMGFQDLTNKLEKLFGPNLCFKYQLPSEDLDVLISVTCNEDVENLVEEYDKNEAREGSSRLRAFLFPASGSPIAISQSHAHYQAMEEIKSPTRDHHKASPSPLGQGLAFSMAELNLDSDHHVQGYHHPHRHNEVEDQHSPRQALGSPLRAVGPYPFGGTLANYSRAPGSSGPPIDYGGRGPALTTSALGALSSSQQQQNQSPHQHFDISERGKAWEEGVVGMPSLGSSHRDDKHRGELDNNESHRQIFLHDSRMVMPMVRIPSKDIASVADNGVPNAQLMMPRQPKPQMTVPHAEMLHHDYSESFLDSRQDMVMQGNTNAVRRYVTADMQRAHHAHTASDMQWGPAAPQPSVADKCIDDPRNDGETERGHRRHEMHSAAENVVHAHHFMRHEEAMGKQQGRHGEYEVPLHSRHEHVHHMGGKSHFQPVYWQLRDGSQEHQQYQDAVPEVIRVGHGGQRHGHVHGHGHGHGQSFEAHVPLSASSGAMYMHYQHPTPNVFSRAEAMPSSRLSSPSYRQGASESPTSPRQHHLDATSPTAAGQIPTHVFSTTHGMLALHHEGKAQQISGQMFSDPAEGHHRYVHNGKPSSQHVVVERGISPNVSAAMMVNQGQFPTNNKAGPADLDGSNVK